MSISLTAAAQPAPLIGRDAQLAQLDGLYDRVLAEGGRVALIGGDAGAGKTSLVQRFVRSVADRRPAPLLVVGQCVPFGEAGLPYAPVVGVLRALQARHGDERLLEWAGGGRRALAGLLPDLVEAERAEAPLQLQLFEAVARIWQRAAELEPLIVVLEDLHWADESSRNLLRFLVRYLDDARVLVIGTYRTDETGRRHLLRPVLAELARLPRVDRMQVGQLDRAQVAELVARLLGRRADAALVNRIHRRSDGLPFYVEELTQSAMRAGQGIPESLREALGVRFEALGSSAQDTLRLASVAGNRVSDELLAEVAGAAPELEADLREAVDAGVLVVDGNGYAFRHSLLRETVYDDLLPGQRARLHARFAAALERRPDLAGTSAAHSIALHWSAAGDTECAFSASVTAARSSGVAFSEALRMFETVLDLWDQVADPVTVAGRLDVLLDDAAKAAADAGEDERAVELYGRALELGPADDVPRRIKRLISRSRLQAALLRPGAAVDVAAAVDLLPQVDDPLFRPGLSIGSPDSP